MWYNKTHKCKIFFYPLERGFIHEKIYKIITVVIEDVSNSDTLSSKIPEMMRVGQEAVIAIPKENDPKSIRKFISKMRLQVLNDHRKKCEKLIA